MIVSFEITNNPTGAQMETILIVDDNPIALNTIRSMVKVTHPSSVVIHASHGAHAWGMINAGPKPHLVITDKQMPEMDGIQLTEKIRKEHPEIRVILMSGDGEPEGHQAHAYLDKPCSLATLLKTIRRIMQRP